MEVKTFGAIKKRQKVSDLAATLHTVVGQKNIMKTGQICQSKPWAAKLMISGIGFAQSSKLAEFIQKL